MLALLPVQAIYAAPVGHFTIVKGSVEILRKQTNAPIAAQVDMEVLMRDGIRTNHRSRTQLKLIDDSVLNMGPDYMMEINEYIFDAKKQVRKGVINVLRGKIRATVAKIGGGKDSQFEIHTPTAIAAARGTEFIVYVNSSHESEIIVTEGTVAVKNKDSSIKGEVLVGAGQQTRVMPGRSPTAPVDLPPAQIQRIINDTTLSDSSANETTQPALQAPQYIPLSLPTPVL